VVPGQGAFRDCATALSRGGLGDAIKATIGRGTSYLGICLGMQLMCSYSEENDTECLGIFEEKVKKFRGEGLKVPQIGWNNIYDLKTPLFEGVKENSFCYFVHGYYAASGKRTIATTNYGQSYSSGLHRDNFYGVQFHPEKSATAGERILKNFLEHI